jgi:hypothetical protein
MSLTLQLCFNGLPSWIVFPGAPHGSWIGAGFASFG